nr:transposase [Streptomyces solaniscabiei]
MNDRFPWHGVLTRLQPLADAKGAIGWDLSVDSTVCRAHRHATGTRKQGDLQKEPPGGVVSEPRDHGLGRSRGGFTTKLHLAVEQGQRSMSIVVTAGQRGGSPQFELVLERVRVPRIGAGRPRVRPDRVRADKAYASRKTCLPAMTWDSLHHPGQDGPGPLPEGARFPRWPSAEVRLVGLRHPAP